MEEKIINEIKRSLTLMQVPIKNVFLESNNNGKSLIVETSIKPKLNFPNAKSFTDFKAIQRFNSVPGLIGFKFSDLKGWPQTPQNIDQVLTHVKKYKPLWVAELMERNPSMKLGTAEAKIAYAEDIITKIKNNTINHGELEKLTPDKKKFGYETITNAGGLRDAIMHEYMVKYPQQYNTFLKTIEKGKPAAAADLKLGVSKVNSEKVVDAKIKGQTNPTTKKKYTPEDYKTDWKNAGGNESKIDVAVERGWVKGKPVDPDLKVKGSTPKPKGTPTPKPKYKKGTIGSKITSETDPKTGNPYDIEYVMKEFGSNRTASDNTKLGLAWDDGWRPGDTIKPEFKPTGPYKKIIKKGASKETPKIDSTLQELINKTNLENDPSGRKSLYTEEKAYKQFGADEDNPAHVEKLKSAWAAGWRPGKPIDDYPEFIIKDSTQNINKMMKDNPNKLPGDSETLTESLENSFGIDPGKPGDYELFYDAWKSGEWRPFNEKGYEIPVPEKYRTELYIARQNPEKYGIPNKIFQDSPNSPGFKQRVTNIIKAIWYNQASFWEDILTKFQPKSSEDAFNKIMDNCKKSINEWFSNTKASNFGTLREQFLKLQRDNKFAAQIAEKESLSKLMEKMKQGLFVAIDNEKGLTDEVRIAHKNSISEFFVDFEKNITDFKSAEKEFASIGVGKNALQKWWARFWAPLQSGKGKAEWWKSLSKLAYQRIGNWVRNGQFFTNAENVMIRSINKYTPRAAWKNAVGRLIMGKIVLPIIYFSLKGVWVVGVYRNLSSQEGVDMTDEGSYFKYVWDDYLDYITLYDPNGEFGLKGFILEGLRTATPGELMDWAVEFGYGAAQDPFNTFYRIEYKIYENNVWSDSRFYPQNKDEKLIFKTIETQIIELKKRYDKSIKFCDATVYTDKKENRQKLKEVIGGSLDPDCGGKEKPDAYKIKYYWESVKQWVPIPKLNYDTFEEINAEINELIKENPNVKICDISDKKTKTYTSNPLKIPTNNVGNCSGDKKPEDKKPEDKKTTITPGQTVEYLAFVANRDLGRSSDPNMYTEQPILNYKNNKVWTISSEKKIVYCFSIDTSYNIYMKQLPESEFSADNIDKINELSGWVPVTEKISESTMKKLIKKIIMESNKDKKFGEESFEHWKKTFRFHTQDAETKEFKEVSKETIEAKQVEIEKMLDHYRKKYDEDDSFVRSVVDVFSKDKNVKNHIKKIGFNKGLAHISETVQVGGLLKVLSVIRESKELEIWSVKYYNDGNWELVKGSFNDEELKNVGKTVTDRNKKDEERRNPVEGLKKKELTAIEILKQDEKKGLSELPSQVKRKTFEKLRNGWVTEKPYDFFDEFYTVSDINTVFNDKIKIYKLNPTKEFFESLLKNSSKIFIRKGFCKSLNIIKNTKISDEKGKKIFDHILNKCQTKFKGEYGITQINKYL